MDSSASECPASFSLGEITRRQLIQGSTALLVRTAFVSWAPVIIVRGISNEKCESSDSPYDLALLPEGIRSRFIQNANGLTMHILEAGFDGKDHPLVVLLHGFPELAYSWRRVMLPIAAAGFHVVAPDRRGYGRTSGWAVRYEDDLSPFFTLNQLKDALTLVFALGYRSVAAVIGHDMGSPMAAWCSLVRPDVFRSVVMMSAPFAGPRRFHSISRRGTTMQSRAPYLIRFTTNSQDLILRVSTIKNTLQRLSQTKICGTHHREYTTFCVPITT